MMTQVSSLEVPQCEYRSETLEVMCGEGSIWTVWTNCSGMGISICSPVSCLVKATFISDD